MAKDTDRDKRAPSSLTKDEQEAQKRREAFMSSKEHMQDIDEKYDEQYPWWTR